MKNSLSDLNNHLFKVLEDLSDPEEGANLEEMQKNAKTICNVADTIINVASVQLDAMKLAADFGLASSQMPELLIPKNTDTGKRIALPGDYDRVKKLSYEKGFDY